MKGYRISWTILVISILLGAIVFFTENTPPSDPTAPEFTPSMVEGLVNITLLPAELPDAPPITTKEGLERIVRENMSSYFYEQSYGALWTIGRSIDWIQVAQSSDYYRRNKDQFRHDVLAQVRWTKSNFTAHIIIVYSGNSSIRAHHTGARHGMSVNVEGTQQPCELSVVPELRSFSSWLHEMGHGFGLDDYYCDDEYRDTYLGEFIGPYALMSQNEYGLQPSNMCAYSKIALGWIRNEEILEITSNGAFNLLGLNIDGEGTKVLRVRIDSWRHYLIEARPNLGLDSGVLVFQVDRSRNTGGFGRLELARSYRSIDDYNCHGATFRVGESFLDGCNGIIVSVVDGDSTGYTVRVELDGDMEPLSRRYTLGIGEILETTSIAATNGSNYMAICARNGTTGLRAVYLYRYDEVLVLLYSSPLTNDSYHPLIVEGRRNLALLYESSYRGRHSIIGQCGSTITLLSGSDDAQFPTAASTYNHLWIAYENRSAGQIDIAVYRGSAAWTDRISLDNSPHYVLKSSDESTVKTPSFKAEVRVILSYINSTPAGDSLEIRWGSSLDENCEIRSIRCSTITQYHLAVMPPFWVFASITQSSSDGILTDLYFLEVYEHEYQLIGQLQGDLVGSIAMLGFWVGQVDSEKLSISRVWNRHRESDLTMQRDTAGRDCESLSLISIRGSPGLLDIGTNGEEYILTIWFLAAPSQTYHKATVESFSRWAIYPTLGLFFVIIADIMFQNEEDADRRRTRLLLSVEV